MAMELLLEVLKSEELQSRYGAKVQLAPVMDRDQTSQTKECIQSFQVQHKQVLVSLKSEYHRDSELIGSVCEALGKMLHQLILAQKGKNGQ